MSKKYYIAADGGGSKLLGILYDDELRVVRHCKLSGVNSRFKPVEVVQENLSRMLDLLLSDDVLEIESADLCLVCREEIWAPVIKADGRIKSITVRGEAEIALGAAFKRDGIVALSGTGSNLLFVKEGKRIGNVGGLGPLLGDEGSGYDIGLRAIKAAIYASDGRGEPTVLSEMVFDKWQTSRYHDIVMDLAKDPDARHKVASVAAFVSLAANQGDKVAQRIYECAADELFIQTDALIAKGLGEWDGSVVIMGGAWKGYFGMLDRYRSRLLEKYPNAHVIEPDFEPAVGCAVCRCFEAGLDIEIMKEKIYAGFSEFLYEKQ